MNWYKIAQQWSEWEDFLEEFGWHRDRGIGASLSNEELKKLWTEAPISYIDPRDLDKIGNTYTPEIQSGNKEERIRQFIEFASGDNRDDVSENEWASSRKMNPHGYLNRLLELVGQGSYPPVNIIDVPEVGKIIVGGRTRAAAAKALDIPLKVRIIQIPRENGDIEDEVKSLFYDNK